MIQPKNFCKLVTQQFLCMATFLLAICRVGPITCAQPPACLPIARSLPPRGLEIPAKQANGWLREIEKLESTANHLSADTQPDVLVLLKACRYAIEFNELYQDRDAAKVERLLKLAAERITAIEKGEASWQQNAGRQVRGFQSKVDGSTQPLGLILPEGWQKSGKKLPLYVWLHGRGDKSTDLHFICERLDRDGQIVPPGAIVVHPFGRQCIGYKSAGETDVMEAVDFVCANYPVDEQRIVLMGFSMGGAGVWHLAAHYGERFVAASPGAGFAETARYQGLKPEQFPPKYEQMLWGMYDVPGYTRNLFNLPVIAYSGEVDKQIQAARVMEEAYMQEGRTLTHLIGPAMGHKYHPDTLQEILDKLAAVAKQGKADSPNEIFIQTKHPRYASRVWLTIDGAETQYSDTRADAKRDSEGQWQLSTKNASRLRIDASQANAIDKTMTIDGQSIRLSSKPLLLVDKAADGKWTSVEAFDVLRKRPGLSGPMDDAFIDPFLVVVPSKAVAHPKVEQWLQCELANFKQRWRMVFRGDLRIKQDVDVTPQDMQQYHLVLWGDASSNQVIKQVFAAGMSLPFQWSAENIEVAKTTYASAGHVLQAIYPNPLAPDRYVVLNSGPTFRQAHDRTNSLQNPHLPDWAVISLDEPPSAERPGKIAATGFFNDDWLVDSSLTF
jgi:predicted esterase